MIGADLLGYTAALLVFAAFWMREMATLRALAVGSNIAFGAYGYLEGLPPVLLLHAFLLPLNALRLWQACRASGQEPPADLIGGASRSGSR